MIKERRLTDMKSDPETAVKRAVTGKMDIGYIFLVCKNTKWILFCIFTEIMNKK